MFLKKWLAPILRNLADTPERMAELDVNEGVVPLIEMRFPPPGTLLTPVFPAPTNARTFVILRLLGVLAGVLAKAVDGRMPADQETIRYTGVYGDDPDGRAVPDARGARRRLRRPLLRRRRGHHPRRPGLAEPADASSPRRGSRSWSSGWGWRSTPAVRGEYRGGLGYEKHIRMLRDAHFMSIADRSILACWGVRGGRAGRPFQVVIDPGGPGEREVDALADAEPVRAGEVIRIRTTGGGGWGDPLDRDPTRSSATCVWAQGVAARRRCDDYGVVVTGAADDDDRGRRRRPSDALRAELRPPGRRATQPFFDRGPGYARLAGGRPLRDVDWR